MKCPVVEPFAAPPGEAELLAEIGHELRNPLTSILAFADALQNEVFGPLTDIQKNALAGITTCVYRQTAQVQDLIDLRKFECGLQIMTPQPCKVSEAVAQAIAQAQPLAQERRVGLHRDPVPEDWTINADLRCLNQLIALLLQAGLMAAGKAATVQLLVRPDGQSSGLWIRVIVAHSGASVGGIEPPANTGTDVAMEQRLCKLGPLGFSLIRHILKAHGGSLNCQGTANDMVVLEAFLPAKSGRS